VIPDDRNCALFNMLTDGIHNPFGLSAVSDVVPQKCVPIRTVRPSVIETGFQRLSVSVDVGKERRQHWFVPIKSRVIKHASGGIFFRLRPMLAAFLGRAS
jgi:hypothetical protein